MSAYREWSNENSPLPYKEWIHQKWEAFFKSRNIDTAAPVGWTPHEHWNALVAKHADEFWHTFTQPE
jgi:hypothetical protein